MHQEALLLSQCLHLLAGAASDLNGEELEEFAALMQKNTAVCENNLSFRNYADYAMTALASPL
jgi:hypothetical protein